MQRADVRRLENCLRLSEYTLVGAALLLVLVGVGWFGHELEVETGFWCAGAGDKIEFCVINHGGHFGIAALNLCSYGIGVVNVGGWVKGGVFNFACFYGAGFRNFACAFANGETEPSMDSLAESVGVALPPRLLDAAPFVGGVLPDVLLALVFCFKTEPRG